MRNKKIIWVGMFILMLPFYFFMDKNAARYGYGLFTSSYPLIHNTTLETEWNRVSPWIVLNEPYGMGDIILGFDNKYKTSSGKIYNVERVQAYSINTGKLMLQVESENDVIYFIFSNDWEIYKFNPLVIDPSTNVVESERALLRAAIWVSNIDPPFWVKYWRFTVVMSFLFLLIIFFVLLFSKPVTRISESVMRGKQNPKD